MYNLLKNVCFDIVPNGVNVKFFYCTYTSFYVIYFGFLFKPITTKMYKNVCSYLLHISAHLRNTENINYLIILYAYLAIASMEGIP